MKQFIISLFIILGSASAFANLKVYELYREKNRDSNCDYIVLKNDTVYLFSTFQYRYDSSIEISLEGVFVISKFRENFYELYPCRGEVFDNLLVQYYDVPAEKDKNIIFKMPKCNLELKVGVYPLSKNTDLDKKLIGSTSEIKEDINSYLAKNILKNGELIMPYFAKDDIECLFELNLMQPISSNMIGQYFGLNRFYFSVKLVKNKRTIISFPNIDDRVISQYYFKGDFIYITDTEIRWKNDTFKITGTYPQAITDSILATYK